MSNPITFVLTVSVVPGTDSFNFNLIAPDGCYRSGTRKSLDECKDEFDSYVKKWNHDHSDKKSEDKLASYLTGCISDWVEHDLLRMNFTNETIINAIAKRWLKSSGTTGPSGSIYHIIRSNLPD